MNAKTREISRTMYNIVAAKGQNNLSFQRFSGAAPSALARDHDPTGLANVKNIAP